MIGSTFFFLNERSQRGSKWNQCSMQFLQMSRAINCKIVFLQCSAHGSIEQMEFVIAGLLLFRISLLAALCHLLRQSSREFFCEQIKCFRHCVEVPFTEKKSKLMIGESQMQVKVMIFFAWNVHIKFFQNLILTKPCLRQSTIKI